MAGGWVSGGLVARGRSLGGWWLVAGGLVAGGWWLVAGGCGPRPNWYYKRLATGHQQQPPTVLVASHLVVEPLVAGG